MSTLVYSYGAKHLTDGLDRVHEQISLAHKYYNVLIELHRGLRDEIAAVRSSLCPELENAETLAESAEENVDFAIEEIRRLNAIARRKRCTPEETANLAALKEIRALAWAQLKEVRQHVKDDPAIKAALESVYATYHGVVKDGSESERKSGGKFKDARAACGVYFGTYLKVEAAVEQAVQTSAKLGLPPKFRRWTGDGAVTVQLQGGLSVADAFSGRDTRLRIGLLKRRGQSPYSRCAPLVTVSIRVGSNGRDPVWAKVPVYLHRPLPQDATIMWASLVRKQVAVRRHASPTNPQGEWRPYYEWEMQFTLRTDTTQEQRSGIASATGGACGIDLGWRLMEDGSLRVAYIVGDDGRNEPLTLPATLLSRLRHSDDIRSIRDGIFTQVCADVSRFRRESKCVKPEWFMEMTATVLSWKRTGRMATLLNRLDAERFTGDELIIEVMRVWRERDAHLWQYESANRTKALAIRKHLYRTFASQMRATYATISVEDCDWRTLAKLPAVDDNSSVNTLARWHQRVASVGMLRECLLHAGASMNKTAATTRECHACGHVNDWQDKLELVHTCAGCGLACDQDENAARVLLARGTAANDGAAKVSPQPPGVPCGAAAIGVSDSREPQGSNGETVAPSVPSKGGRWARRKADRSQRLAEMAAATPFADMADAIPAREG